MWDIGNTGDLTQGSNTVGEQTLAARFESRMVCFFVEHDRHTLPTQQDREGRTRRPTAHDRDIGCPFHDRSGHHSSVSISAEKPGPRAMIKPVSPALGRPEVTRSLSINSTDALD